MSVAQGTPPDLPGYCARTFTLMPVGYTPQRSVQVSGFTDICLLTPLRRLYPLPVRQASALPTASSGFAVARDTLAVRLTLPLAGCVVEWRGGIAPPRSPRTGREPLGSSGSYRPAGGARDQCGNRDGWRRWSRTNQAQARNGLPLNRLYLRCAQRIRKASTVSSAVRTAER